MVGRSAQRNRASFLIFLAIGRRPTLPARTRMVKIKDEPGPGTSRVRRTRSGPARGAAAEPISAHIRRPFARPCRIACRLLPDRGARPRLTRPTSYPIRPASVENPFMDLAKHLKIDSVSRLRPRPPVKMRHDQSVAEAVRLMRLNGVGCVLVCAAGRLTGIFTDRDLMFRVMAEGLTLDAPVWRFMTPDPVVVRPKESINVALNRMVQGGYRHLPVVDEAGRPTGVLSVKRLVHYLVEHFAATVYNLPPDQAGLPLRREGA